MRRLWMNGRREHQVIDVTRCRQDPDDDVVEASLDGDAGKWEPDPVGFGRPLRAQGNRTPRFGGASDFLPISTF